MFLFAARPCFFRLLLAVVGTLGDLTSTAPTDPPDTAVANLVQAIKPMNITFLTDVNADAKNNLTEDRCISEFDHCFIVHTSFNKLRNDVD
jgi:hypothetical protein